MNTETPTRYLVEILGANSIATRVGSRIEGIHAHTSMRADWRPAEVWKQSGPRAPYWTDTGAERRRLALFTSRRAAEMAVSDGELWNGQTYRIRAARGEQLREGVVIKSYQAPCRPRRDPTAGARKTKCIRLHPDTIARLDAEARRSRTGVGAVVDRLAATL